MENLTTHYYSTHYLPIQQAKYTQLWPHIKPFISPHVKQTLLDTGIGPAWLESFFVEKNMSFTRVVGVDVSEASLSVRKKGIEYVISSSFDTDEKFDLVICFDAWHCFPTLDLKKFLKPNGVLIVSEPRPFAHLLDVFSKNSLVDEWVGGQEKSRVILLR